MRRRPAEPGHRPRRAARFAAGRCRTCSAPYVLDRSVAPWARARTCSPACRARLGHRDRWTGSCRHCAMVELYRLERDTQLQQREVAAGDEDDRPVTFRAWLAAYQWEQW